MSYCFLGLGCEDHSEILDVENSISKVETFPLSKIKLSTNVRQHSLKEISIFKSGNMSHPSTTFQNRNFHQISQKNC